VEKGKRDDEGYMVENQERDNVDEESDSTTETKSDICGIYAQLSRWSDLVRQWSKVRVHKMRICEQQLHLIILFVRLHDDGQARSQTNGVNSLVYPVHWPAKECPAVQR
jgi:hypothetical protein